MEEPNTNEQKQVMGFCINIATMLQADFWGKLWTLIVSHGLLIICPWLNKTRLD
jgi:hypothetical protein